MNAELRTTYSSPTVAVTEFFCKEEPNAVSDPERTAVHAFSFVRHGSFVYETEGERSDLHTHHILLENAGEHHIVHHHHTCGDECVIVEIPERILDDVRRTRWCKEFRGPQNRRSSDQLFTRTVMSSTPVLEYLQSRLVHPVHADGKPLERMFVDSVALRLADELFNELYRGESSTGLPSLLPPMRSYHLEIIERAKQYMVAHLSRDLSLSDIAVAAHASEFHFSRIFKAVTGFPPHQYLLTTRLHHALLLLQETRNSVTEIASLSGFNSLAHFTATFSGQFGISPSGARSQRNLPSGFR